VLDRGEIEIRAVETAGLGSGIELSRGAVRDGWPLVVAVGGDGTVNEVVNGVMDGSESVDTSAAPTTAVAVIPTGRGRDVCRNLGIAADPMVAARRVVEGDEIVFDVGVAESADGRCRYFVSAAGVGFDAAVAERARRGWAPGTIGYLLAVLKCLGAYRRTPRVRRPWRRRPRAIPQTRHPHHLRDRMRRLQDFRIIDDGETNRRIRVSERECLACRAARHVEHAHGRRVASQEADLPPREEGRRDMCGPEQAVAAGMAASGARHSRFLF